MTKEEIAKILAELDADLKKSALEVEAKLRKADEGDEGEDSSNPAEGSSPEAPPAGDMSAGPAEGSSPEAPPAGDMSAGPAEGSSPEAPPAGDPAAAGGDPAAGGELTPEALQAEYAQLPPEELDMHIQAALAAKEALQGAAGPGAGAPPGAMPPPGPEGASAGGPPPPMMGKTQIADKKAQGGQISTGKVAKSEEITKLEALVKSQQEDIENLSKVVKTVLETPVRKSVTALSDVAPFAKTEVQTLSKKEVDEFIKANVTKMTKAERELWLSYVDNKVPAAKLAPMFERLSSNK